MESIGHLALRVFHIGSLSGNAMLESHSNHINFYEERASRKIDFFFSLFFILPEMLLLLIITDPYPNDSHSNNILRFLHENFNLLPVVCGIFNLLIMFAFTQQRVSTAKEALGGTLIDIKPRYLTSNGVGILTKVHPNDSEIGKPIHENFNDNVKSGGLLCLKGVRVAKVEKEEYTWTEPVESYSRHDGDFGDGGYGYGCCSTRDVPQNLVEREISVDERWHMFWTDTEVEAEYLGVGRKNRLTSIRLRSMC